MLRRAIAERLIALAFWLTKKGLAGFNFNAVQGDMENLPTARLPAHRSH